MRKYLRRIALARMRAEGIQHPNREQRGPKGERLPSFFASNWRDYAPKQPKIKLIKMTK